MAEYVAKDDGELVASNMISSPFDSKNFANEMRRVSNKNSRIEKAVVHIPISFPDSDKNAPFETKLNLALDYIDQMRLQQQSICHC